MYATLHIVALQVEGALWENLHPLYGVLHQSGTHRLVGHLLIVSYVVGCYLCLSNLAHCMISTISYQHERPHFSWEHLRKINFLAIFSECSWVFWAGNCFDRGERQLMYLQRILATNSLRLCVIASTSSLFGRKEDGEKDLRSLLSASPSSGTATHP